MNFPYVMYPSSINRALCSDGMRCIKPLAPSRNETNSSRVNVGADGAILGICAPTVATIKPDFRQVTAGQKQRRTSKRSWNHGRGGGRLFGSGTGPAIGC
jgi:hypothetical protein